MEAELDIREDATLAGVRRRGLLYLNYVFWALALSALLLGASIGTSLFGRWIAFLGGTRKALGIGVPVDGPDYWILSGGAFAILVTGSVLLMGWHMYRKAWNRRLSGFARAHVRIRRLRITADDRELAKRKEYMSALAAAPEWRGITLDSDYKECAAAVLKVLEVEVAHRAVTAGLVVGLNRNAFIDSVSILAAALELQFHVLTRLGKQPSFRTWTEMLKRTSSSLFLNWYVSRGDALYIKLAIKKTAWGLGIASDLTQQAADSLDDIDWDEIAGGLGGSVPQPALHVMSALGVVAAKGMTVGAFGLRQLSHFVEVTADDLLQGVLAGGILYYHGMALAAECLALDEQHRNSPEMNRTIAQAMSVACAPAGRVLLDQVRAMRQFLRERRRMMFARARKTATDTASSAVGGVRSASTRMMDNIKSSANRAYGKVVGSGEDIEPGILPKRPSE
jgi:hypothetical protein